MNTEAFLDFWDFINKRHSIYLKREAGEPKPWTDDSILQSWRFCNPFRYNDKQTKWLLENVLDPHDNPEYEDLLLFNTFAFRAFNWYETFEWISDDDWFCYEKPFERQKVQNLLEIWKKNGHQLTSGAYMIRGYLGKPKWQSIPETLEEIWLKRKPLAAQVSHCTTLEEAHQSLLMQHFWGWGEFTVYQVILDLMYTHMLSDATDINTWTLIGPGAVKGLREIWSRLPKERFVEKAVWLHSKQGMYLEDHVPIMNLQDIEFCLCELGKYRRIKAGGKGKEKYAGS